MNIVSESVEIDLFNNHMVFDSAMSKKHVHVWNTTQDHIQHYSRGTRAKKDSLHRVVFAVKQKNLDELARIVDAVSFPDSPRYGHHLTRAEVAQLTANPVSSSHLLAYLAFHNIGTVVQRTLSDEYIEVEGRIDAFEQLFNSQFYVYHPVEHLRSKLKSVIRCEKYDLPQELVEHIDHVFETAQFPAFEKTGPTKVAMDETTDAVTTKSKTNLRSISTKSTSNYCSTSGIYNLGYVQPCFLNQLYEITNNTCASSKCSQAVFETNTDNFSPSDLTQFQTMYNLPLEPVNNVIGRVPSNSYCVSTPNNCMESNLDVQYLMAVAQNTNMTYNFVNSSTTSYVQWLMNVASMTDPPLVFSISWGGNENQYTGGFMTSFNTEALKLSAMGITLLASSGDDGVSGHTSCYAGQCGYNPQFPASSPYVTAVGGTQVQFSSDYHIVCTIDFGFQHI